MAFSNPNFILYFQALKKVVAQVESQSSVQDISSKFVAQPTAVINPEPKIGIPDYVIMLFT
jgi:hypothetical protein